MENISNSMAEFFERLGHRTIQTETSRWYEVQPGVLLSFPYHRLIEPGKEEIDELFNKYGLKAIRYPTSSESFGFPSVLEVNTDPTYDLSWLEREARRQTRRGLENCTLEQIDFDYLMQHGLALNRDTAKRQGRHMIYTDPEYWKIYCNAGKQTPGITAWGVMTEGQLGTYLVAAEEDNWWNWLLTNSSTALLKKRTSNILFYQATKDFFSNNPSKKICYGLGSLEDVNWLDYFKKNMGITMQPIKQRLIFSKKLQIALAFAREPCIKMLNILFPRNYTVRKTSAMIRLYRQQSSDVPTNINNQE